MKQINKILMHLRMITILGSLLNIMVGGSIGPFNEHNNIHFDNETCIHLISEHSKELKWLGPQFGFSDHLLLMVRPYYRRKRLVGKSLHLRPIHDPTKPLLIYIYMCISLCGQYRMRAHFNLVYWCRGLWVS